MKIAFTTSGSDLNAPLDGRFGRATRFLIFDLANDRWELIDNTQNLNAVQGAGIQAAETVARAGVAAVVTGNCGPKAFRVLSAAGVGIFTTDAATVGEALAKYRSGTLPAAGGANVQGHWS